MSLSAFLTSELLVKVKVNVYLYMRLVVNTPLRRLENKLRSNECGCPVGFYTQPVHTVLVHRMTVTSFANNLLRSCCRHCFWAAPLSSRNLVKTLVYVYDLNLSIYHRCSATVNHQIISFRLQDS